ncbi:hypothetical protein Ana3638_01595 [Anaerocolumna sedimenticola]|uniref:Uncharacterized protein n=1 Tax=Anaerocolumna sedimenticola TaxID=2696063 RepID=A0A6P1THT2_9FIRM|nr:hypothetical protein [Anaerocolumna sedimenticola]QHQ59649.1 hypothetical protein Ana3638_01595 [Anaerocolumna sedimenticola]
MKLKYKKMIIIVSMSTMGIGMVTFSINYKPNGLPTDFAKSQTSVKNISEAAKISEENDVQSKYLPTVTPSVTPEVDIISEAVATNVLEKDAYNEINKLIGKYYVAKLKNDIDNFKPLVNDSNLIDMEDNSRRTKYIDDYKNLACYTKKALEEGTFIVYAYQEVKFNNIETLAPGLDRFYVKTNDKGKPYIYFGEIDKNTENYINETQESEDVMKLINSVNMKYEKAAAKDSVLYEFKLKLEESIQNVAKGE